MPSPLPTRAWLLLILSFFLAGELPARGGQEVSLRGELRRVHFELPGGEREQVKFCRVSGKGARGRCYPFLSPTRLPHGSPVRLRGRLTREGARGRLHALPPARRLAHTTLGPRSILVVPLVVGGLEPPSGLRELVLEGPGSLSSWLSQQSGGGLSLSGRVSEPVLIASTPGSCEPDLWSRQATGELRARGIQPEAYAHLLWVFATQTACLPASGMGTFGGSPGEMWMNGYPRLWSLTHELGHNLNLAHTGAAHCPEAEADPLQAALACPLEPYADPFSPMGGQPWPWPYSIQQASAAGLVSAERIRLAPAGESLIGLGSLGPALRLPLSQPGPDGQLGWSLTVELPGGLSAPLSELLLPPQPPGLLVRLVGPERHDVSRLLDFQPATRTLSDGALPLGGHVCASGRCLSLRALGARSASVSVSTGAQASPPPPPRLRLQHQGGRAVLDWSAQQASSWLLLRDEQPVAQLLTPRFQEPLGPPVTYVVVAVDQAGNRTRSLPLRSDQPNFAPPLVSERAPSVRPPGARLRILKPRASFFPDHRLHLRVRAHCPSGVRQLRVRLGERTLLKAAYTGLDGLFRVRARRATLRINLSCRDGSRASLKRKLRTHRVRKSS